MIAAELRRLAGLLADRVQEKRDAGDQVAMFTTARLLDQVNEELGQLDAVKPPGDPDPKPGRRVFVKG
ncbi:MAG TPA: hypothetical protein VLT58_01255 [Polyangia bacterium]|nr:hypothetical protein [Polyangia bacterium]